MDVVEVNFGELEDRWGEAIHGERWMGKATRSSRAEGGMERAETVGLRIFSFEKEVNPQRKEA